MAPDPKFEGAAAGSTVLGYPRFGANRALKVATERYWRRELNVAELSAAAADIRRRRWQELRDAGIDQVPCNDFSLYDHMLDTAVLVGAIPARHRDYGASQEARHERYFAMARGGRRAAPLEMTKWFDTNYHYLVPEIDPCTDFSLDPTKPLVELAEAGSMGLDARPVFVGPMTFLLLSKPAAKAPSGFVPMQRIDDLIPVYAELLHLLRANASWVQFDEPALVCDQPTEVLELTRYVYEALGGVASRPKILLATYFDALGDALPILRDAPIDGVAMDFCGPAGDNLDQLAQAGGLPGKRLVAGVIDGRNVWVNDFDRSLATLHAVRDLADEVVVAPSCSLLHVPLDVDLEPDLDVTVKPWLSFARQKLHETAVLARGLTEGLEAIGAELGANRAILADRATSAAVTDPRVRARLSAVTPADFRRTVPFAQRAEEQSRRLRLPLLPTTTIGSFPQTGSVREARAKLRQGRLSPEAYRTQMRAEVAHIIALQEEVGLDVLVHGEPERGDMVQYFAGQLSGVISTAHGWVQSYGTRYVRPPVIFGDVARPAPMTVEWFRYAQALTTRPVKGMLTGPITMLRWSFVRDDQPLSDVAKQLALALRDEVADLEAAGAAIVQVDEPALREGLPLRRARHGEYLRWAVEAFRLATSGVRAGTQIHTHMCYAEFGDVLQAIADLDADVISLEAARSGMTIVDELADGGYPAAVGPGVYDIHSPRIPEAHEMAALLARALRRLPAQRLWVNPDCGLKTRSESEVLPALRNLVAAARTMRAGLSSAAPVESSRTCATSPASGSVVTGSVVTGAAAKGHPTAHQPSDAVRPATMNRPSAMSQEPAAECCPDGPPITKCSARGCPAEASWVLIWNNPGIHEPDREKMWTACDAHKTKLTSFLASRSFLKRVEALQPA